LATRGQLTKKPAVIGHSFGGLIAQIFAGPGSSVVAVAVDPVPFRGVLPLRISALKASRAALGNPGQPEPSRAAHFRYSFANAVSEDEAKQLYDEFAVSASGAPLFQAATATSIHGPKRRWIVRTPSEVRC
jgi:non-heme chloroperoxidase